MTSEPSWVISQQKTYTKWINAQLSRKFGAQAIQITQLKTAFRDGIVLFKLFEALFPDVPLPPYNKTPKMRPHSIDNVATALALLGKQNIDVKSFTPTHFVDGNLKMVLGLCAAIIQTMNIGVVNFADQSGQQGLLVWCQRYLDVLTPPIEITNFTSSFADGRAFCALVNGLEPNAVDMSLVAAQDAQANLTMAFQTAERRLDVPRLLDVADMLPPNVVDEKSVLTYVSELFRVGSARHAVPPAATPLRLSASARSSVSTGNANTTAGTTTSSTSAGARDGSARAVATLSLADAQAQLCALATARVELEHQQAAAMVRCR
jgi:hypothetical protein